MMQLILNDAASEDFSLSAFGVGGSDSYRS